MIELPEALTIAQQMNDEIKGKRIESSIYMDSPHRFAFYDKNRTAEEHETILSGRMIGQALGQGSHILVPLEPDYVLRLGDGGERILFHQHEDTLPRKHQLLLHFQDETYLTVSIQGWGAVGVHEKSQKPAQRSGKLAPLDEAFTLDVFQGLFSQIRNKKSIKHFMISDPGIPGVGNGCLQDILFRAKIHPKTKSIDLTVGQQQALYRAMREVLTQAVTLGGRDTERDLYNQPGGYLKLLDSRQVGQPCPDCETPIEKIQYLGGSCYLCPQCQVTLAEPKGKR